MRPRPTLPTWWRFTLHLNAPAWIGGARARLVDEDLPLRTASVRGALRHWLRLALGEVLGGGDGDRALALGTLRELETVMFGAVGRGAPEGARVLLKPPVGGRVKKVTRQDEPKLGTGRRYMSYGVFDGNKRPEVVTGLTADDAHPVHLVVGLHVRSGDSGPQREALRRALGAVLWLWGSFGGLGGRSRRGWGGVELLPVGAQSEEWPKEWAGLFSTERPVSRVASLNALFQGLDRAMDNIRIFAKAFGAKLPTRPVSLPELRTTAGIQTLRAIPVDHPDGEAAIEHAGAMFMGFRGALLRSQRRLRPLDDYFVVRGAIEHGQLSGPIGRAAFGLPLAYRFRSLNGRGAQINPVPPRGVRAPRGARVERMPSGLLFRVVRLADQDGRKRFYMMLVYLEEGRPPLGSLALSVKVSDGPVLSAPNPGDKVVMDFLNLAVKREGAQ